MAKKYKNESNNKKIKYIVKCEEYEELIQELLNELKQSGYSPSRIRYYELKCSDIKLPL